MRQKIRNDFCQRDITKKVVEAAHAVGVSVEAELGALAGIVDAMLGFFCIAIGVGFVIALYGILAGAPLLP